MRLTQALRQGLARGRLTRQPEARIAATLTMALLLVGCAEQITVHGHQFREADIQQIQPGMGQEQVRMSLGSPTTTSSDGTGSA
jgi:outer membrane protein assembly factor BamE (lipoprotein component of BamABCDE complex)